MFIDGQNVTIGARYAFGHGNMHPLLLGRALAGKDELVEIRYATGIPDADVDRDRYEAERRRHDLMAVTDVVVLEKTLKYRWEWMVQDRDLGDPRDHRNEVTRARVKSKHRGGEKGVDVWLALDALTMCTRTDIDKVIVATADADLDMVPQHLRMMPGHSDTRVVQAKVLRQDQEVYVNPAYDETVAIDERIFATARDDFDYSRPLNEDDVAAFVQRIGSEEDGIRD